MTANLITLIRLILVFAAVALFNINFYTNVAMFALIVLIIVLDWADGYVARKKGTASDFGALFDIAGDRIVENVLWIYFAVVRLVPIWVPLIVLARGFITDLLRSMAFATKGKTPFGKKTMMKSNWARALVSSRVSRGIYAAAKVIAFCYLAAILTLKSAISEFSLPIGNAMNIVIIVGSVIVYITVGMCVIRGLPVIWDGKKYLLPT
jgi:CDP-diacylglycerol--glycerol-3-phosphate 3-phosphatidyltransferase